MKGIAIVTCAFVICIAIGAAPEARAKEQWDKAQPDLQKIGVELVVCKDYPEQLICLGLGCASGAFELISIRSASGAFTEDVQLSAGGKTFDVRFSDHDPKIMEVVGTSGSRAKVSSNLVDAIAASRKVTIRDPKADGFTESYLTKGLKALLQDPKGSCAAVR